MLPYLLRQPPRPNYTIRSVEPGRFRALGKPGDLELAIDDYGGRQRAYQKVIAAPPGGNTAQVGSTG